MGGEGAKKAKNVGSMGVEMTTNLSDLVHVYDATSGVFVNERHRRVAEVIHDYYEHLQLVWIPDSQRDNAQEREFPFAILHKPEGQQPYIVRHVRESEVNERLLAWLWSNDNERSNPILALEKADEAKRIMEAHAAQETRDEAVEIGTTILKSNLHSYRHNGKVYK